MAHYEDSFKHLADDTELKETCHSVVKAAIQRAQTVFDSIDYVNKTSWALETESEPLKTKIYSKKEAEGKLFALKTELPCDLKTFFHDYWVDFPLTASWNPTILFSKLIANMSDECDIAHYANKDMFAVSARDFVIARGYHMLEGGAFIAVGKSIVVPELPATKECVRAELLLGAGRFTAKEGDPNVTVVDYLLSIDLKGLLPKMIVNAFMGKMMLNDLRANWERKAALMNRLKTSSE